jgi:hypothetical protein
VTLDLDERSVENSTFPTRGDATLTIVTGNGRWGEV